MPTNSDNPGTPSGKQNIIITVIGAVVLIAFGIYMFTRSDETAKQDNKAASAGTEQTDSSSQGATVTGIDSTASPQASSGASTANTASPEASAEKLNTITTRVARETRAAMQPSVDAMEKIRTMGDMSNISSKEDVEARISALDELRKAAQDSIAYYNETPDRVKKYLDEEQVPASEQENLVKTLMDNRASSETHSAYKNSIIGYAERAKGMYQYLDSQWGNWKFENGAVTFTEDPEGAINDDYTGHLEKQQAALDAMVKREEEWNKAQSN